MLNRHLQRHTPTLGANRRFGGFSLIEVLLSVLIIMILATGAMGYQYLSTRDVKISEVQATAARLSLLLLESWKGRQGATDFDPVSVFGGELTIQTAAQGPAVPLDGSGSPLTPQGTYGIQLKGVYYYVTLSYAAATASEPALLSAGIAWRRDFAEGDLEGSEKTVQNSTYVLEY